MKRFMSENGGYGVAVENDGNITVRAFDAELLIRNTSDGKKCLYNIVGIKENTANAIAFQDKENRLAAHIAASQSSASIDSVSAPTEISTVNFPLRPSSRRASIASKILLSVSLESDSTNSETEINFTNIYVECPGNPWFPGHPFNQHRSRSISAKEPRAPADIMSSSIRQPLPKESISAPLSFQPADQLHEFRGQGNDPDDCGGQRVSPHVLSSSRKLSVAVFSHRIYPNCRTLTGGRAKMSAPASSDAGADRILQRNRYISRMIPPSPSA